MSPRLVIAIALVAAALVAPAAASAGGGIAVDVGGNGSGTVTTSPAGINCTVTGGVESGDCYDDDLTGEVQLRLAPAAGSLCQVFADVPPTSSLCVVVTSVGNQPDLYRFVLSTHGLTVSKTGDGSGKVTSSPAGIDCGATCSKTFDYGTKVTLTASPNAGAVFKEWTGACAGQGASCTLTITQATSANAVFGVAGAPTTPTAPTPPTTPTGGQADTVEVDVIAAAAGKSRLGKRVVRLELSLQENVSATLRLVRRGTTLATKQFARVREGERLLTLRVPAGTAKGRATLRFVLKDQEGNTITGQRGVRIGTP
jgi:Divergent InlB B-repeat domain